MNLVTAVLHLCDESDWPDWSCNDVYTAGEFYTGYTAKHKSGLTIHALSNKKVYLGFTLYNEPLTVPLNWRESRKVRWAFTKMQEAARYTIRKEQLKKGLGIRESI